MRACAVNQREMTSRPVLKRVLTVALDTLLSSENRVKLARYILNRELGEGIGDPALNGENDLVSRLRDKLGDQSVVIDVGANVGQWTTSLAQGLRTRPRVFSFEPVPGIYARLVEACERLETAARVTPVCAALSDTSGTAEIHVAGDLAETNSLHHIPGMTEGGKVEVELMRGDDFCRDRGIDEVDVLKLDVEGNEVATMRGFSDALHAQRIGCVQFEYGTTWLASRTFLADAFELLTSCGYRVGRIVPGGVRPIDRYTADLDRFRHANFLAVRDSFRWLLRP